MKKLFALLLAAVMVMSMALTATAETTTKVDTSNMTPAEKAAAEAEIRYAISLLYDRNYIVEEIGQAGQVPASSFVSMGMTDADGSQFYQNAGHNACDYAAVDGKSAVAHGEYLRGICDEIVELEQNVVQPCAYYAGRDQPDDEVEKIIGRKAEFRRLLCTEKRSENKACGDYHAVKVYLEAEDREAVGGIDAPIPQHGEAYRRVAQHGRSEKIHRFITPLRG